MSQIIPVSFPFARESLSTDEFHEFLEWYSVLRTPDKENVETFLLGSLKWITQDCWAHSDQSYFVMNAIGSTTKKEPSYEDVDFLLLTGDWKIIDLLDKIGRAVGADVFDYKRDNIFDGDYQIPDSPKRSLLTLTPRRSSGKTLHLTVQPETPSETEWAKRDKRERIVIYRATVHSQPVLEFYRSPI
ncbi:MAG: hypothetical protein ABIG30_03570 [Candidatus Aenigmatarchaeota archaeon]